MLPSTMQDYPLSITAIFRHGQQIYSDSAVCHFDGVQCHRSSFSQVAARSARLANALRQLDIHEGDRVATFCWNTLSHLEAYFAVPCMGAVLHPLNIRLAQDQIVYIINHAEDKVVIVDESLLAQFAALHPRCSTLRHVIVVGDAGPTALGEAHRYEDLLSAMQAEYAWPTVDERAAAVLCYTSGTTGNPKGVAYSHRSTYLHSMGLCSANTYGLNDEDRVLVVVPMFHASAWGLPYAGWMAGCDLILPGQFVQAAPLSRLIAEQRPSFAAAVPTVWNDLMRHGETHALDLTSLRLAIGGGAAVAVSLVEKLRDRYGVCLMQGWGMTETNPLLTLARAPRGTPVEERALWQAKTGRVRAGIELRVVDDVGNTLEWDGHAVGELEVRGAWVTGSYYRESAPEKFDGEWLRTGDVGTVDRQGYVQITDRAKDVIKSGGEWISSVALENLLMGHKDVLEASVIGVPDDRWQERPLACVVTRAGSPFAPEALHEFLGLKVPRWWLPERWAQLEDIPKTSVGKFDKKRLREAFANHEFQVTRIRNS
jgi:fatty-acyl-CoA synthase